ncbi:MULTISPECIES: putative LPS assembly protein LptD [unclassified Sphingobacterium]|uniref:putative LPS assembly protein LptD n=1 Tax=unclassified Sphingobacterium TaxID=2609468 RepID=UPI0025FF2E77|nr:MULTISPECIES: putative LPS assembly protein LptD [unclassified Sphingobacterium]
MKSLINILTLFIILATSNSTLAQSNIPLKQNGLQSKDPVSTTSKLQDTTKIKPGDSTKSSQDTTKKKGNGLQAEVSIIAVDSQKSEVAKNISHLYRGAKVKYQDFELSADYIRLDRNQKKIFASGIYDKNGKYVGRPIVIMGNGESPKTVDSLYYDYEKQEGNTYGIMTEVDGGFIQANIVRKNIYDEMSIYKGLYSTCNLPYPHTHFGIHISKGIVTKNQIISGPAYLVVMGVPMPVAFPFAFFPKPDKRASGFLFPSFGEDYTRGFSMRDIGWYLAFNDYWDSEIRGSLYSKGSWEASINTRYTVNYKFNGGFNIRYANTKVGVEGTDNYGSNKDFNVTWNHTQRQEANPGTSFSASVNFGTASYFQNTGTGSNQTTYQNLAQNRMGSSISYGKVFADGKVNLTASLTHSQDMANRTIQLSLPNISLNVSSFNPFDSKDRVGEQKWYQRINVGYSFQAQNTVSTADSLLFSSGGFKRFQNGFQHNIPVSLSLNAFKYFQFNTSVNYTERWYLQSTRQRIDNTPSGYKQRLDTLQGFNRAYDYSISTGLSTKIYGMYPKIGKIEAIRHVVTPSINFNYRPDFSDPRYGFYQHYNDQYGNRNVYSIFAQGIYGSPSAGKSAGIGFSIDNNIEAKVKSKSDTTDGGFKKIPILQGLTFSGNYNFVRDSLKLDPITFSGRTAFFDQKMNVNFNGTFDPYSIDDNGVRINRYAIKDGSLARLTNFGLSFDYSLNPKAARSRNDNIDSLRKQMSGAGMTPEQAQALARISSDPNAFVDFNIPWNLAASFSFNMSKFFNTSTRRMDKQITSTLNLHGDFSVTPKWKVTFQSGYDFKQKEVVMTSFNIYRDLHCWDMSFGWMPFGRYRSYNVTIRAKASILQDLKLTKRASSGGGYF